MFYSVPDQFWFAVLFGVRRGVCGGLRKLPGGRRQGAAARSCRMEHGIRGMIAGVLSCPQSSRCRRWPFLPQDDDRLRIRCENMADRAVFFANRILSAHVCCCGSSGRTALALTLTDPATRLKAPMGHLAPRVAPIITSGWGQPPSGGRGMPVRAYARSAAVDLCIRRTYRSVRRQNAMLKTLGAVFSRQASHCVVPEISTPCFDASGGRQAQNSACGDCRESTG